MTQILFIVDTNPFESKSHEELLYANLHGHIMQYLENQNHNDGFGSICSAKDL